MFYIIYDRNCTIHTLVIIPDFVRKNTSLNNYPEDRLILTKTTDSLNVVHEIGTGIKGTGNQISGMDTDNFEISTKGISYSFYDEEFPEHV